MELLNNQNYRKIQKKFGKTYYFSSLFFDKATREDVLVLYAFFRIPDEVVDNPTKEQDPETFLKNWKEKWETISDQNKSDFEVLNETYLIFKKHQIPKKYGSDFIDAMILDLTKKRYENYSELENYMYGSAGCVGLILTHILGYANESTLKPAEKLGYAMQMTNFLRDIKEDFKIRNRIYLPKDSLEKFKITENYFEEEKLDANFEEMLKEQIAFTRNLFVEANLGIKDLKKGKIAVYLSSYLYSKILDKIEKNKYDVFKEKAKVRLLEKIFLTIKILWKIKIQKKIPWQ